MLVVGGASPLALSLWNAFSSECTYVQVSETGFRTDGREGEEMRSSLNVGNTQGCRGRHISVDRHVGRVRSEISAGDQVCKYYIIHTHGVSMHGVIAGGDPPGSIVTILGGVHLLA